VTQIKHHKGDRPCRNQLVRVKCEIFNDAHLSPSKVGRPLYVGPGDSQRISTAEACLCALK